ncbi:MAG: hypothetical protein ACJ790_02985 [Myxococcaceae bacterium]
MANDPLKPSTLTADGSAQRTRSAEDVRAEIARARAELQTAATQLRQEVAEKTDWRMWVRKNPAAVLTGAFVVGFWLGYRD